MAGYLSFYATNCGSSKTPRSYHLIAACIFVLGLTIFVRSSLVFPNYGSDFIQDYVAAHALRQGASMYGQKFAELVTSTTQLSDFRSYHPPWSAFIFLPFSYFAPDTAFLLWNFCSLILYLWLIHLGARHIPHTYYSLVLATGLLWYPFIYTIGTGQSSVLIAACLWAGYLLEKRNFKPEFCLRRRLLL